MLESLRKIQVKEIRQPSVGGQFLAVHAYEVNIWEDGEHVVVEARIPDGVWETLSEPEKRIKEYFARGPLPKTNTVINIPSLD